MQENELNSIASQPDTKAWLEFSWKLVQEGPNRFEDSAKFLTSIIAITITILLTTLVNLKLIFHSYFISMTFVFWIAALLFAFFVMFPQRYSFSSYSTQSVKETITKIANKKRKLFIISVLLYFIPFVILTISFLYSTLLGSK